MPPPRELNSFLVAVDGVLNAMTSDDNSDPEPIVNDDAGKPPSVGSYLYPLLLVILICAGFLYWRRTQRGASSNLSNSLRNLRNLSGAAPAGVRLSMEDDGPASHSFISNNASTDSLPPHALQDLPLLPQSQKDEHPARQSQTSSPLPGHTPPTRLSSQGSQGSQGQGQSKSAIGAMLGKGRRSARQRGPVEGTDGEDEASSDAESDSGGPGDAGETVFGIGDDEEAESSQRHIE